MKTYNFKGTEIVLIKQNYASNKNMCIWGFTPDNLNIPYIKITTNLGTPLSEPYAYVKDWSENEGVREFLIENKIAEIVSSCEGVGIYRFKEGTYIEPSDNASVKEKAFDIIKQYLVIDHRGIMYLNDVMLSTEHLKVIKEALEEDNE